MDIRICFYTGFIIFIKIKTEFSLTIRYSFLMTLKRLGIGMTQVHKVMYLNTDIWDGTGAQRDVS